MSQTINANKSAFLAAATAMSAAGFLALPTTAHADPTCTDYGVGAGGDFGLTQTNGYGVTFFMADVNGRSFNGDNASAAPLSGGAR